jgi:hypothetical protein
MKFLGNYKHWITDELMNHLINSKGDTVPVWQPERWSGHPMLDEAREQCRPGYEHSGHNFQQFNYRSPDMANFDIILPELPNDCRPALWWFIKLLPGQMQTMHFDPHLLDTKNPARYTIFLQDWIPGHIFAYNDKMLSNYKAGDMFKWNDPMMYHGVVNIGYKARYTLQITTYDL